MAKTYFPLSVNPGADPSTLVGQLPTLSALRQSTIPQPGTGSIADTDSGIVPGGNLGRGTASGFQGALANIQAYGAAMADSMGFKDFADGARQSALRRAEFAQSMAPTVGTTDQIHGFHDALKYGAGAFGGALGSLAPTAVAGALGGTPGAFMSLVPMSGGEVAMRQYAAKAAGVPEAQNVDPRDTFLAATGQGLLQGGLNLAPIMSIVGKGPLARMATRSGVAANPIERFATRAGTTALAEGAQEGGEELTNQLFMQALHGKPLGQDLDTAAIRENAIAGAVERMVQHVRAHCGTEPICIMTGGAGWKMAPSMSVPFELVDNLIFDGLLAMAASLGIGFWVAPMLGVTLAIYWVLQVGYSMFLKHQPIIDLAMVTSGFLLRAVAGGVASGIELSQWFLLVASFGSLFMVAGKRYSEMVELGPEAGTRPSLARYTPTYLRFVWTLACAAVILSYSLWAFEQSGDTEWFGLPWHAISIAPFTLALLRYAYVIDSGAAGEPEDVVASDRVLQGLGVAWVIPVAIAVFL